MAYNRFGGLIGRLSSACKLHAALRSRESADDVDKDVTPHCYEDAFCRYFRYFAPGLLAADNIVIFDILFGVQLKC